MLEVSNALFMSSNRLRSFVCVSSSYCSLVSKMTVKMTAKMTGHWECQPNRFVRDW